jgi:hypothetical protein
MEKNTNYKAIYYAVFSTSLIFPVCSFNVTVQVPHQYKAKSTWTLHSNFKSDINHFNNNNPPADQLNLLTPPKSRFLKSHLHATLTYTVSVARPCSRLACFPTFTDCNTQQLLSTEHTVCQMKQNALYEAVSFERRDAKSQRVSSLSLSADQAGKRSNSQRSTTA